MIRAMPPQAKNPMEQVGRQPSEAAALKASRSPPPAPSPLSPSCASAG